MFSASRVPWGALRTLESGAQLRQVGAFQSAHGSCTVPSGDSCQRTAQGVPVHGVCNSGRATAVRGSRPGLRLTCTRHLSATLPPHQRSLFFILPSFRSAVSFSSFAVAIAVAQSFSRLRLATQRVSTTHLGHATSCLRLSIDSGAAPWTTPRRRQRRDGPASKRRPSSSTHPRRSTVCQTKLSSSEHLPL